ncbi:glucan biosynthesis protein [Donghicola sp. XS_ASV15]|uniref:glucan biosynthesis protein n=1 Tax=Donghicola sp. XS_ASV15 TaxID=3241295 RepID=UPI00351911E4
MQQLTTPFHQDRVFNRRSFLAGLACSAAAFALTSATYANAQEALGEPFSFDILSERMKEAAQSPLPEPETIGGFLADLNYDAYQRIRFLPERARWHDQGQHFRMHAFHLGWLFKQPVHINEVVAGEARPMTFSTRDFYYPESLGVPENAEMPGIAGFRIHAPMNRADIFDELIVFLGASYFRALGRDNVYGLSARGLAVNTGLSGSEEFPRFSEFWLERPEPYSDTVTICAALTSKSVTGAYRFVVNPGDATVVDVTARLYMRNDVEQLGIAPLTSMFLFAGNDKGDFDDFRAAVHDSEALVLNTRSGETFYRPLKNPMRLASSYLGAENPKSFGLVQRSRDFDSYLDAQAHYEKRPSLMIEPLGDWGKGSVRLVEIPSDMETNDNIVAFWIPEAPAKAGQSIELSYRMHWGFTPEGDGSATRARVVRTRVGEGGVAGVEEKADTRKFVVDFQGGTLSELPADADVEPAVTVNRGEVAEAILSKISGTDIWRLVIEVKATSDSVVELKAAVEGYEQTLTETWLYQWMKE